MKKFFLLIFCLTITACSAKVETRKQGATLTGKVTQNNQPVTSGRLYFLPQDDKGAQEWTEIKKDGTFVINGGILPGQYVVYIQTRNNNIPDKYKKAIDSPWKVTVEKDGDLELSVK